MFCRKSIFSFFITTFTVLSTYSENNYSTGAKLWLSPHEEGTAFYNTVTVEQHTKGTVYEVCAFNKGFIGLIEGDEKGVQLQLWDRNNGRDDASAVKERKRAKITESYSKAKTERFGGNGSGAKIFLPFNWAKGQQYHFLIDFTETEQSVLYTGYFYHPKENKWITIGKISYQRPREDILQSYYCMIRDLKIVKGKKTSKAYFKSPWFKHSKTKTWQPFINGDFQGEKPVDTINAGNTSSDQLFIEIGPDIARRVEFYSSFAIKNREETKELKMWKSRKKQ